MAYDAIEVTPLTARIGAEIGGVDLRSLTNHQVDEIGRALVDHQVIFFREQPMEPAHLSAPGRSFGELATHSAVPGLPDHPELVAIHADKDSKFIAGEDWHSDLTCDE